MLVKKVTNFREFGYLNSSLIRKIIISMLLSSSRDKLYAFVAKLSDRCFSLFQAAISDPSGWAPTWSLHTNLYKFGWNISPHILLKKICSNLNLRLRLCIFTFFLFPDSGVYLWSGFDFFDLFLMVWHWKPAITLQESRYVIIRRFYIQLSHNAAHVCCSDYVVHCIFYGTM